MEKNTNLLCRWLAGLALALSGATIAWAQNADCAAEGGAAECPEPPEKDFYCTGSFVTAGSSPCKNAEGAAGTHCRAEGEAIDQAIDNFVEIAAPCGPPSYAGLCPAAWNPDVSVYVLGKLQSRTRAYIAKVPSRSGEQCVASTIDHCGNPAQPNTFYGATGNCSREVSCPPGMTATGGVCKTYQSDVCKPGNPMDCVTGEKTQTENDVRPTGSSPLEFTRYYSSQGFYEPRGSGPQQPDDPRHRVLGPDWRHSYQRAVRPEPAVSGQPAMMTVMQPSGDYRHFKASGSAWVGRKDKSETLQELIDQGVRTGWRYQSADNAIEIYDAAGVLQSISYPSGQILTFDYSTASTPAATAPLAGLLIEVADSTGRSLKLRYDNLARVTKVIDAAGAEYVYAYSDTHALLGVTRPGGAVRTYLYNEAAHSLNHLGGTLLTGIIDENGQRYATYRYSHSKVNEEWHGSAGADLLKITYTSGPNPPYNFARLTAALGYFEQRELASVNGIVKEKGRKRCTSQNCSSVLAENFTRYDANGNVDKTVDYRGSTTEYDFNDRGLETQRREGYVQPESCPATTMFETNNYGSSCTSGTCWKSSPFPGSSSAAPLGWNGWYYSCLQPTGPATQLRSTETDWHASFNLPLERRVRDASNMLETRTRWTYNSRGQVTARCEIDVSDAAAMAYVCSTATAPPAGAKVRRRTYAYCEAADVAAGGSTCPVLGLLKSSNGPRGSGDAGMGGLDDVTTYAYYATTDVSGCGTVAGPCRRKGDLWKTTNALGHVNEVLTYDGSGRVVLAKSPNGVLTGHSYHARGWLTAQRVYANATPTVSASDAVTTFAHDGLGQVTLVTPPDGAALSYVYDDAHRLTDIVDSLGNRIHYTLDAAGNRIKEDTYDIGYNPASPGTGLKRALSREFNALRRLVRERDAAGTITRDSDGYDSGGLLDGYDARGNEVAFKDGRNIQTRNTYDPLNRLVKQIEDYAGSDPETANATVEYGYDARDNVRTIKDPDGLTTTYTYDALGNRTGLASPDTGQTVATFDLAGNMTTQTDNRGISATYVYDALNRPVQASYPTSALNETLHYDESDAVTGCTGSFALGRPTRILDSSGTTTLCYDRHGNVTRKTHSQSGVTLSATFAYTAADRIAAITYPGGGIADYAYDAAGRISQLTWKSSANATPVIVASAGYYPFGPLSGLTFGNGRTLVRNRDQNYAIDSIASSASDGLALQFDTGVMGNVTRVGGSIGAAPAERKYIYDNLYRITRVDDAADVMVEDYGYNRTGDRTSRQLAGQPVQAYGYLAGTHRLGTVAGVARSYDANGNTTGRGDGVTLGYDDRNRLASAVAAGATTSYDYSALDERTRKLHTSGGTLTTSRYLYDTNGQILADELQIEGGKKARNVYLFIGSTPVAVVRGAAVSYLESDHLDTPRVAVNPSTNAVEWRWDLLGSAFGDHAAATLVSARGVALRYPGQYSDAETGLYHNYRRDYEAATGRYVESDPIGLDGGWATYEYAGSAALDFIDPDGLMKRRGPNPGGGSCGGSGMGDFLCELPDSCNGQCACKHANELRSCNKRWFVSAWICIFRANNKLNRCTERCSARDPGPGEEYYQ